jgi:glycerophosphoryl diester phosphodiesterase
MRDPSVPPAPELGAEDLALARRHAPLIMFDVREPFFPIACGCTIFREAATSPSFPRVVDPGDGVCVEYAIWWDWDIGHLYELEHIWVWTDGRVEASSHGGSSSMGTSRTVLSEPGKHAFAPDASWFDRVRLQANPRRSPTRFGAGAGGVLVKDIYAGRIRRTPLDNLLVRSYLHAHAFDPSWTFAKPFELSSVPFVGWPVLDEWIPRRVEWWLDKLPHEVDRYRPWRIGHRGAAAHAPGNTPEGIRRAAELMADMAELDVRVDEAGRAVISHDPPAGGEPSLRDALDLCADELIAPYLELKDDASPAAVAEALGPRRSIVASFDASRLRRLAELAPAVPRSILFRDPAADPLELAESCGARYVHPCWERFSDPIAHLTPEWLARVRDAGLGVLTWHEERPDVLARLKAMPVDGICSDVPELLL